MNYNITGRLVMKKTRSH